MDDDISVLADQKMVQHGAAQRVIAVVVPRDRRCHMEAILVARHRKHNVDLAEDVT
jgi:hypothetical protein